MFDALLNRAGEAFESRSMFALNVYLAGVLTGVLYAAVLQWLRRER